VITNFNLINTSQLTKTGLKKYSAKCFISGDHAETYEYHRAKTGAKPGKRTEAKEPRKREARFDNVFRAMRQVKRVINANAGRARIEMVIVIQAHRGQVEQVVSTTRDARQ